MADPSLAGTLWELVLVRTRDGAALDATSTESWLLLDPEGGFRGRAGNVHAGTLQVEGDRLLHRGSSSHRMAFGDRLVQQVEDAFLAVLRTSPHSTVVGDVLELREPDGGATLRFRA